MSPRILLLLLLFFLSVGVAFAQSTVDVNAKLITGTPFNLSPEAEAAGLEGKVVVAFTVDKNGEVTIVVPAAGPSWPCGKLPLKELENMWAALKENVKASHFSPAIKNGQPISSNLEMTYLVGREYRAAEQRRKEKKVSNPEPSDPWIEGGVVNGKALSLPKPDYPAEAHANRISGTVSIEVLIDESGKVIRAGATSGHPLLQGVSRQAACGAKFSPTLFRGEPVKVSGAITYNFVP